MKSLMQEDHLASLIRGSLSLMCKTSLNYETEIEIKGLLGITVDKKEVFLVDVREFINIEPVEDSWSSKKSPVSENPVLKAALKRKITDKPGAERQKRSRRTETTDIKVAAQQEDDVESDDGQTSSPGPLSLSLDESTQLTDVPAIIKVERDSDDEEVDETERDDVSYGSEATYGHEKPQLKMPDKEEADFNQDRPVPVFMSTSFNSDRAAMACYNSKTLSDDKHATSVDRMDEAVDEIPSSDSETEETSLQENISAQMPKNLSFYLGRIQKTESSSVVRKVKWAIGSYNIWRAAHAEAYNGETPPSVDDFLNMSHADLCSVLVKFITGARKQGGTVYPPKTMLQLLYSLMKHLSMQGKNIPLWNSDEFVPVYVALENNVKESLKEGVCQVKETYEITREHIEYLWSKGHLGDCYPEQMIDTLFWLITWHFGIFAGTEHRALSLGQFTFGEEHGQRYVELCNSEIKCRGKTRVYEDRENPARCLYRILTKYISLVKIHCCNDKALYLHPATSKMIQNSKNCFRSQPLGQHQLAQRVKKIMNGAGFEGNFKNISLYRAYKKCSN